MPLTDVYPRIVVFITDERPQPDGTTALVPIGTGFLVTMPSDVHFSFQTFYYVVTAGHVARGARSPHIRANTLMFPDPDPETVDLAIPEWHFHPFADVAVAPVTAEGVWMTSILPHSFADQHIDRRKFNVSEVDDRQHRPGLGDRIYFIGLLADVPSMAQNLPLVRSGNIGALYQKGVPVEHPDGTRSEYKHEVHLVDCRSFGGFSGSPCFVQYDYLARNRMGEIEALVDKTLLLGLVSGHLDQWEEARVEGDILGSVRARANSGVGVVIPSEYIRETLELEELVEDRKRSDAEAEARAPTTRLDGPDG